VIRIGLRVMARTTQPDDVTAAPDTTTGPAMATGLR
jgi:hypothetical protein